MSHGEQRSHASAPAESDRVAEGVNCPLRENLKVQPKRYERRQIFQRQVAKRHIG
jgi:hypothetical protein